ARQPAMPVPAAAEAIVPLGSLASHPQRERLWIQLRQDLQEHLTKALPAAMVPTHYVSVDAWPLTARGKLDHKALPAPKADVLAHEAYEAPRGELETTLATLWSQLLGVERIGRHDNFFSLGGHSLLAVRLIERLRRAGLTAHVRTLFTHPTLAALAATIAQA